MSERVVALPSERATDVVVAGGASTMMSMLIIDRGKKGQSCCYVPAPKKR